MKSGNNEKIIKLKDYKSSKLIGELRKYPDDYEYCLIPNYEDKFSETHTECIQMGDCFANVIKNNNNYILISIIFSKEWIVQEILDWLDKYEVTLYKSKTSPILIKNVSKVIEAKKFKDFPIVLSKRGTGTITINPSDLEEVTDEYDTFNKITNTGLAGSVDLVDDFLDKDDCLDRQYPGVSDEGKKPLFDELMANIQYSDRVRGLFIHCNDCSFNSVIIHNKTFEVIEPYCPHCGCKVDVNNCEWVNGPF